MLTETIIVASCTIGLIACAGYVIIRAWQPARFDLDPHQKALIDELNRTAHEFGHDPMTITDEELERVIRYHTSNKTIAPCNKQSKGVE